MDKWKTAAYCRLEAGGQVSCLLCPHQCRIPVDGRGICQVRQNRAGELVTVNYRQIGALQLDPIEKKPLYHFYPGRQILSVGTFGCNFNCSFCQNWQLSKGNQGNWELEPSRLLSLILDKFPPGSGNVGIAFTYNEPLVWYEYLLETAQLAKQAGLQVVLITNGFLNQKPFQELLNHVDALNIDLKSFREEFYRRHCGGSLAPVLANIQAAAAKCHVEITTLLVTGLNDSPAELEEIADWLGRLNPDLPWHLSRYYPNYRLAAPPTSLAVMEQALQIGKSRLNYVYLGNVPGANNTYCPQCQVELISRNGYQVAMKNLIPGPKGSAACKSCGAAVPVVLPGKS